MNPLKSGYTNNLEKSSRLIFETFFELRVNIKFKEYVAQVWLKLKSNSNK